MAHPCEDTLDRDEDDDLRREDIDERHARRRASACQCGGDLPGRCPGPQNCLYSDFAEGDDDFEPYPRHRMTVVLDHTASRFREPF